LRRREPDAAERLFNRAFDWTAGLRSLVDHMTYHIYQARIAEQRDQADLVRRHWLRAALYWVSSPSPEAVSLRTARLLLDYAVPPRHRWVEDISGALHQRLSDVFGVTTQDADEAPTFVMAEHLPRENRRVIGNKYGAVVVSSECLPPCQDSPMHRRLRALVRHILLEDLSEAGLTEARLVGIDDRGGLDIAQTPAEIQETALRVDAECAWFEKQLVYRKQGAPKPGIHFEVSPGVSTRHLHGDPASVTFNRYHPPLALTPVEARMVRAVADGNAGLAGLVAELKLPLEDLIQHAQGLEKRSVLRMAVNV
jgi:hypothetical protein